MKLEKEKKFYVRINAKKMNPSLALAYERIRNRPMLVRRDSTFFTIIDERLRNLHCFNGGFYPYRFIIEEWLQLELEF